MSRIVSQFSLTSPLPSPYQGEGVRRKGEVHSSAQLQFDAAFSSFSRQATDPLSIASMTAVGLVGRVGRVGLLRFFGSNAPLQNFMAHLGSLAGEAATCSLLQGGHFNSHFVNFGMFRLFHTGIQNKVAQHFIQSAAMMAGHQTTARLNLEETSHKSLAEQFIDANLSTLQISAGSALSGRLLAGNLQRAEKNLEQVSQLTSHRNRSQTQTYPRASIQRFSSGNTEAVINRRLQEAYASTSDFNKDTLERIDNCLRYVRDINAARSSSGTFKDALLQHALEGIAAIEDPSQRQEAFESLFTTMEIGLSQSDLENLVLRYRPTQFNTLELRPCSESFLQTHKELIPTGGLSSWEAFTLEERTLLLSFIEHLAAQDIPRARKLIYTYGTGISSGRYDPEAIHRTLTHAITSPLGEYILRRLTYILVCEDHGGKLAELKETESIGIDEIISTQQLIAQMGQRQTPHERIAQLLNDSRHTAYLNDLRVAQGVLRFYQRIYGQGDLVSKRAQARFNWGSTFTARILPRWRRNPNFTRDDLFEMMNANPNEQTRQLVADYQAGSFEIEVLDDQSFDHRMKAENRVAQGKQIAFFMQRPKPQKPLILIRGFDIQNLQDPQNLTQLCSNIIYTIPALIHEWEHVRHFTGDNPFPASLSRGGRMATEALAYLEEYAWKIQFVDDNILTSTALLGMPPVTYFRSLADLTYYTEMNQRLANEVIP